MKIGGHVRFFCGSACREWLVLHAEYVGYFLFPHVERGSKISKATDANLGVCGRTVV